MARWPSPDVPEEEHLRAVLDMSPSVSPRDPTLSSLTCFPFVSVCSRVGPSQSSSVNSWLPRGAMCPLLPLFRSHSQAQSKAKVTQLHHRWRSHLSTHDLSARPCPSPPAASLNNWLPLFLHYSFYFLIPHFRSEG